MVVYDDASNEPVRIFDSGAEIPDPETFGEYQLSYRTGDIVSPRIEATEPLSLELADFAKSILEGTAPASSAAVGLDVVRTIEAVDRSLERRGIPVRVERDGLDPLSETSLRNRSLKPGERDRAEPFPVRESPGYRHPRRGAGGTDRGVHPRPSRTTWCGVRGGRHRWRYREDDRVQRVPLRSRRSQVLHQAAARPKALGGNARRGVPDAASAVAHLLRRQVLRLSHHGQRRRRAAGTLGVRALRALLSLVARHRNDEANTFEEWVTTRFGRRLYDASSARTRRRSGGSPDR